MEIREYKEEIERPKWFGVPNLLAVIIFGISKHIGGETNLNGFILYNVSLIFLSISFVLEVLFLWKTSEKRKIKFKTICLVIFASMFLFHGGEGLLHARTDLEEGPQYIYLRECNVSRFVITKSRIRMYSLEGIDYKGEKRSFSTDEDIYVLYKNSKDFSIKISTWEHSRIMIQLLYMETW
ncbi:MAG: hypothetical protein U0L05_05965 [Schaedlerella sp.]|nr:hypothetical protein [Schaedlerella sp.]